MREVPRGCKLAALDQPGGGVIAEWAEGWYGAERKGARLWVWTAGVGALRLQACPRGRVR